MRIGAMALLCLVSGCAAPVCQPMLEARLFFGLTDEAGFVDFLDREVTPRFPAGLTVLDGAGRWRDSSGRPTQERSRVVDIVTVAGADTEARLEAIRAAYKTRFRQQSVGLVLQRVCADF